MALASHRLDASEAEVARGIRGVEDRAGLLAALEVAAVMVFGASLDVALTATVEIFAVTVNIPDLVAEVDDGTLFAPTDVPEVRDGSTRAGRALEEFPKLGIPLRGSPDGCEVSPVGLGTILVP